MIWAPLLLADPSPLLRLRVLRSLLQRPADDPEVLELAELAEQDPLAERILKGQQADGSWQRGLPDDTSSSTPVLATSLALMRLGYLGYDPNQTAVQRGAEYLFSQQYGDGSWVLQQGWEESQVREGYALIPLQTSLPLRGLAACGFGTDPRAERAYEWLLGVRLPDGAWPTGIAASGANGYVAGYRKIPHSRWGCRSNTTAALICLALHPVRRHGPEAHLALDLLLGRETREEQSLGFEVARLTGAEPSHGFITFYARFDIALLLDLCAKIGASSEDTRIRELLGFVRSLQGPYGLWEYAPRPQVARWLTCDLLESLARLGSGEPSQAWISLEPRTPFQAYPRKQKRY